MPWNKREPVSNLTTLGDSEGQITKVAGLLAAVKPDPNPKYKNEMYEIVQKNGESLFLAGSASLGRQINDADVGHFIRATFKGWGNSANGKFKDIEVQIFEGDVTDEMKAWPRWKELNGKVGPHAAPKGGEGDFPEALDDEDDDLPFDS